MDASLSIQALELLLLDESILQQFQTDDLILKSTLIIFQYTCQNKYEQV